MLLLKYQGRYINGIRQLSFVRFYRNSQAILVNLFVFFAIDALFFDDEPLWEPIEGSMLQTWIFFFFIFAGIGELLIAARFGSYTGRDKRIGVGGYRTFGFLEYFFVINFGIIAFFIITPFYSEITYQISLVVSGWDWFTQTFLFRFSSALTFVLLLSNGILITHRGYHGRSVTLLLICIECILAYFFFGQFLTAYFAYFTDPIWYQKTRHVSMIQNSHGPLKWGWGGAARDYFTFHRTTTVFWTKSNLPFSGAFLLINFFLLLSLFLINFFGLSLLRRVFAMQEIPLTFLIYVLSTLRHTLYAFLMIIALLLFSFILAYGRIPVENFGLFSIASFGYHFITYLTLFG